MASARNRNSRNLKFAMVAVMAAVLVILAAVFVGERQQVPTEPDVQESPPTDGATVAIGKVSQTSSKDGKTEWRLDAESARFFDTEKKVVFSDITVVFYPKETEEVRLTSENGILKTESKNIDVTDHVVVKNKDFTLTTEFLHYDHNQKTLSSKVPVRFSGTELLLTADSMKLDLDGSKIFFQGNVKGVFNEKIKL